LEKLGSTIRKKQYRHILASLFLVSLLLTMMVEIRSQEVPNENQEADTHSAGGQSMLAVISEYFEILAVLLEVGIVILLWKTVKDFAELAKVSKLQTEVKV
jgi:hypothetical protein